MKILTVKINNVDTHIEDGAALRFSNCPYCDGSGEIPAPGGPLVEKDRCVICYGNGYVQERITPDDLLFLQALYRHPRMMSELRGWLSDRKNRKLNA